MSSRRDTSWSFSRSILGIIPIQASREVLPSVKYTFIGKSVMWLPVSLSQFIVWSSYGNEKSILEKTRVKDCGLRRRSPGYGILTRVSH